ncbi:hypothetical protein [Pontivivens ytuae]|uniref:Uncharacterized protein n=1 Tax=Pontivivens ytuae TaxID=2789856 RepID=A0A7S9LR93_9RHOB|nr:hypothetical protein [Pontivivens ytuae]QPH53819.1 hypothetical protein I0K15_18900 [Pontivivens ytuae]
MKLVLALLIALSPGAFAQQTLLSGDSYDLRSGTVPLVLSDGDIESFRTEIADHRLPIE